MIILTDLHGAVDYDKIKEKIKAIIDANEFKVVIIDSAGNIISDKLTFDLLSALMINRLDSQASLRSSLIIPANALYSIPKGQEVIVRDEVYAEGDLYVEGELVVV